MAKDGLEVEERRKEEEVDTSNGESKPVLDVKPDERRAETNEKKKKEEDDKENEEEEEDEEEWFLVPENIGLEKPEPAKEKDSGFSNLIDEITNVIEGDDSEDEDADMIVCDLLDLVHRDIPLGVFVPERMVYNFIPRRVRLILVKLLRFLHASIMGVLAWVDRYPLLTIFLKMLPFLALMIGVYIVKVFTRLGFLLCKALHCFGLGGLAKPGMVGVFLGSQFLKVYMFLHFPMTTTILSCVALIVFAHSF